MEQGTNEQGYVLDTSPYIIRYIPLCLLKQSMFYDSDILNTEHEETTTDHDETEITEDFLFKHKSC